MHDILSNTTVINVISIIICILLLRWLHKFLPNFRNIETPDQKLWFLEKLILSIAGIAFITEHLVEFFNVLTGNIEHFTIEYPILIFVLVAGVLSGLMIVLSGLINSTN